MLPSTVGGPVLGMHDNEWGTVPALTLRSRGGEQPQKQAITIACGKCWNADGPRVLGSPEVLKERHQDESGEICVGRGAVGWRG